MRGPTAEKGHCRRPRITSGTSRIIVTALGHIDAVHGPDAHRIHDDWPRPERPPRRAWITAAALTAFLAIALALFAATWPACAAANPLGGVSAAGARVLINGFNHGDCLD